MNVTLDDDYYLAHLVTISTLDIADLTVLMLKLRDTNPYTFSKLSEYFINQAVVDGKAYLAPII